MGLMIHSLDEISIDLKRNFYLYLLDYGWQQPLSRVIHENFSKISDVMSKNQSVFLMGTVGSHFDDQVLSWHHINGKSGEEILPAFLITSKHPKEFLDHGFRSQKISLEYQHSMILIPIKDFCKSEQDVVELLRKILNDIKSGDEIQNFKIKKEMQKGLMGAVVDSFILEPNVGGLGLNLNNIIKKLFRL
jgi:hypothetical protein